MPFAYEEYRCKSVFNPGSYPDHWFWTHGSASGYRGCAHGCVYCDGRNSTYGMDENFSTRIRVKINAPDILESELRKRFGQSTTLGSFGIETGPDEIFRPTLFLSSGVSDAYQPAEEKYGLTRKMLEVARNYSLPVHVMTKSALVERDIDLLKDINRRSHCTVSFSIPSAEAGFSRFFEPNSPPSARRFEAMKNISRAGIETGICMMPMVPYYSDSQESISRTVKEARGAGAGYVLFGAMTLRDEQEKHFYGILEKEMPDGAARLRKLYRGEYAPPGWYRKKIAARIIKAARTEGLDVHLERHLLGYRFLEAKKAATVLFQLAYFHEITEGGSYAVSSLLKAAREIETMKTDFNEAMENGVIRTLENMKPLPYSILEEYKERGKVEELERFKSGDILEKISR